MTPDQIKKELNSLKLLWLEVGRAEVGTSAAKTEKRTGLMNQADADESQFVAAVVAQAAGEVSSALAGELAHHAQHYWDMAAMYERSAALAEKAGEEHSGLIAEATMQVCRDVAKRLKARAAEVRGIDPAEAAFRDEAAAAGAGDAAG